MKKELKPDIYAKNIFNINYDKLKEKNIKNLIFDIDNTIVKTKEILPEKEVIELFKELKEKGFNLFILTNALRNRALKIGEKLHVKTYYFSMKPLKLNYEKLINENHLKKEETAAIGDQIYTDILGANKMSITSILIDPLSNEESLLTKINRRKENKLINKTKLIKKGNYYE